MGRDTPIGACPQLRWSGGTTRLFGANEPDRYTVSLDSLPHPETYFGIHSDGLADTYVQDRTGAWVATDEIRFIAGPPDDAIHTQLTFQVGTGTTAGIDTIQLTTSNTLASTLGLSTLDIGSAGTPTIAVSSLDDAINSVSRIRGQFGAAQNRLTTTIANLQIQTENLSAAESRIRDVDVAVETSSLTRNSILQQAAISVLAQANTQPQAALQLLQG